MKEINYKIMNSRGITMKVKDKNIVVTGGGNGVGRELVLNLLSKGAKVIAVDINEAALNETVKIIGNNANLITRVLDITNKEAVFKFTEEIISVMGFIDGVINNAGIIQPFIQLKDLKFEQIDRVMNVNFNGTLFMTKALLPHLLTRPEAHIVNIASMGGFLPVPGQSMYGASKAAVKIMTEALYSELLDTNVKVSVVFPGGIATDIKKNSQITDKSASADEKGSKMLLSPSAAAENIINGMEKNKYRFCIGKDSKFLNFLYSINPGFATRFIKKFMGSKGH
jgi:short-subunit dehydrogenase